MKWGTGLSLDSGNSEDTEWPREKSVGYLRNDPKTHMVGLEWISYKGSRGDWMKRQVPDHMLVTVETHFWFSFQMFLPLFLQLPLGPLQILFFRLSFMCCEFDKIYPKSPFLLSGQFVLGRDIQSSHLINVVWFWLRWAPYSFWLTLLRLNSIIFYRSNTIWSSKVVLGLSPRLFLGSVIL